MSKVNNESNILMKKKILMDLPLLQYLSIRHESYKYKQ